MVNDFCMYDIILRHSTISWIYVTFIRHITSKVLTIIVLISGFLGNIHIWTIESDYIDIYIKLYAVTHGYNYRVQKVANFSVKRPIRNIFCYMRVSTQQFRLVPG